MNTNATEQTGSLDAALANAARLLATEPRLAAAQAREILKEMPGQPLATLVLGRAQREAGEVDAAAHTLQALCTEHPQWGLAHQELGIALGAGDRGDEALGALRRAVELKPDLGEAWRALAEHLHAIDDAAGADDAYAHYLKASHKDPRLLQAAAALCDKRIPIAEALLREYLKQHPTDVAAIRMLAEVAGRLARYDDAAKLLERCLELAPTFAAARHNYALVLHRLNRFAESRGQIEQLLATAPRHAGYNNLHAAVLGRLGEHDAAIKAYELVIRQHAGHPKLWLSYGHALRTAGRVDEGIAAYRAALRLQPALGEAWWSLANLKTFRFAPDELARMEAELVDAKLGAEDRYHVHFALAKGYEDGSRHEDAFRQYAEGNRLRRAEVRYEPDHMSAHVSRSRDLLTPEFFATRRDYGVPDADPIFILGLPRAGSTLLEQILSSHSAIEGTMELPDLIGIARELGGRKTKGPKSRYPEALAELTAADCRAIGRRYLEQTRAQRKTDRPYFIDKMPNNFEHIGLIQMTLPNARIIDARRHPLACGYSLFKQHFARGQFFSYDLVDIGRYYRDYVALMAHFDAVLPGRIHRVIHERVIEDTEGEIRRMLAYCELPFEDGCLRFFENDRGVRTPSSEQVRRPINRDGVDQWRNVEPWLGALIATLGPVLVHYPEVPDL